MLSFQEEYLKALDERAKALQGKRALFNLQKDTEKRKDDLLVLLFGDGVNKGIVQALKPWVLQRLYLLGVETTAPDFTGDFKSQYISAFQKCVTGEGDGEDGFYPPDPQQPSVAQKEFNKTSKWVTTFGEHQSLKSAKDCARQLADKITSSDKEGCLDQLQEVISLVQSTLVAFNEAKEPVGTMLPEFNIQVPSVDTSKEVELQSMLQYLSAARDLLQSSKSQPTVNAKLTELKSKLRDLSSFAEDYGNAILDWIFPLKLALTFWVELIVRKPDGVYAVLGSLPSLIENAEKVLAKADERVSFLTGNTMRTVSLTEERRWLTQPKMIGIFRQPIFNLDKSLNRWELIIQWGHVPGANQYKLLYKPVTSFAGITNDQWTDGYQTIEIKEVNEAGFAITKLILPLPSSSLLYRVVALEAESSDLPMMGDFNTESIQSDIVSEPLPFTISGEMDGKTVVVIDSKVLEQYQIGNACFLLVDDTLAQVLSISEDKVMLDSKYSFSKLRKIEGLFYAE